MIGDLLSWRFGDLFCKRLGMDTKLRPNKSPNPQLNKSPTKQIPIKKHLQCRLALQVFSFFTEKLLRCAGSFGVQDVFAEVSSQCLQFLHSFAYASTSSVVATVEFVHVSFDLGDFLFDVVENFAHDFDW